jgi:ureidoglycolate dehydrogenase (NAD+)
MPVTVTADALKSFVRALFAAYDFPPPDAQVLADVLVWANLRGVDSHGVLRAVRYLNLVATGMMNPRPDIQVVRDHGAIVLLDADRAAGPVAMMRVAGLVIAKAKANGIGAAAARRTTHTGPVGYYARIAARQGCIGIVTNDSQPMMTYHGTRTPVLGTSPLAIAAPTAGGEPLMLDIASAEAAMGKIHTARAAHAEIPRGWALDKTGAPTTDPNHADILLPLGGFKGAGLAFMLECLTGILTGNPVTEPALATNDKTHRQNALMIAIDVAAFGDAAAFAARAAALAAAVKRQPRAEGVDEILAPGERGDRILAERSRAGIPVENDTWAALKKLADARGVTMPAAG